MRISLTWLGALLPIALFGQPAAAGPAAPSPAWTQVTAAGPARRIITALAFDAGRARTVMFGGDQSRVGVLGDTWEWDGAQWAEKTGPGPAARYGHVLAYDPERKLTVMFGGFDRTKNQLFGDTWTWDGTSWTKLDAVGPAPRRSPAFAYHFGRKTLMLFGGLGTAEDGSDKFFQDTWEWDGKAWKQLATEGPPPCYGAEMAYDQDARRLLLFGGNDHSNHVYGETWAWTKNGWKQLATAGPSPRGGAQLVYLPASKRVHLFGGFSPGPGGKGLAIHRDEWSWNGTAWEEHSDPTQPELAFPRMNYDAARDRLVYVGQKSFQSQVGELWERSGTAK